jgi:hypothetical protein
MPAPFGAGIDLENIPFADTSSDVLATNTHHG